MTEGVRIGFADDHPMLLRGIVSLFRDDELYSIVGTAVSADTAVDLVRNHRPDVMVLDLSMPGEVFASITQMTLLSPETRVVIFTAYSSIDAALKALEAGAIGFVLKDSESDELFDAVTAAMAGDMYVTKQYAVQVMTGLRDLHRRNGKLERVHLSPRERQIVALLAQARTNREIADALQISERTVKSYMSDLMSKLQARNRVEVAVVAQRILESEHSS